MEYRKRPTKKELLSDLTLEEFKTAKRLANNTYEYFQEGRGAKVVRQHRTDIIVKHLDGSITLSAGGWETVTTKSRINEFSPFHIWQEQGTWYLNLKGEKTPFEDGMTIPSC